MAINMPAALPDGIQWALAWSVQAYGVSFSVRVTDPTVAEDVISHLPPGSTFSEFSDTSRLYSLISEEDPKRRPRHRHSVYLNNAVLGRSSTLQAALRILETDIQLHVAEMAPDRVFVHAGVIGYQGRAILLPGRSFSGKSTLVAALVKAGAHYYSDEYAVLDSAGKVYPYPRPLSLRLAGGAGVRKQSIEEMGGTAGIDPLPVGLVVVAKFRKGAEWRPNRLSPGAGVLELLANTVSARRIPEIVMATLHQIVSEADVVASERGEAVQIASLILDLAKKC